MQAQKPEGTVTAEEIDAPTEAQDQPSKISLEAMLEEPSITTQEDRPLIPDLGTGIRSARVVQMLGRTAMLTFRGHSAPIEATLAPEVEPEVISDACKNGDNVLVELERGQEPLVVGVLQTRRPREVHIKAESVHIEGEKEVIFKSGRGALRIREDGDIELVGSRISAASRGLFRIVGRLLRLN